MRILLAILILLTLSQFSSCGLLDGCDRKNEPIVMSYEAKQWLPYEPGDKLVFGNDTRTDTVVVSTYLEKVELFFRGDECPEGKMETLNVRMTSELFEDSIKFRIQDRYRVLLQNEDMTIDFDEGNTTIRGKNFSPAYHETLTIGGRNYTEALVSTCDTCDNLIEIVFAKNVGLVSFRTQTDRWFKE